MLFGSKVDVYQSASSVTILAEENTEENVFQKVIEAILDIVNNLLDLSDKLTTLFDTYVKSPIEGLRTDIFTLFDTKVYKPLMTISEYLNKGVLELIAESLRNIDEIPQNIANISSYYEDREVIWAGAAMWRFDDFITGAYDVSDHNYWGLYDTYRYDDEWDNEYSLEYKATILPIITENRLNRRMMQVMKDSNVEEFRKVHVLLANILTALGNLITGSNSTDNNVSNFEFDYERLENMLKNMKLGNIINESNTSIWDFLSNLIQTLGQIVQTGFSETADIFKKILDFLNDLSNKIISLLIPTDTEFIHNSFNNIKVKFNVKFGSILMLGDIIKEVFSPTPISFKSAVSFDFLGTRFEPDFAVIDPYVAKLRNVMSLSIWLSVAIYIFRRITGTGDLINDN